VSTQPESSSCNSHSCGCQTPVTRRDFIRWASLITAGATVVRRPAVAGPFSDDERLDWHEWDESEFEGRTARLEIVNQATEVWGHINVDQIVFTDAPASSRTPLEAQEDFGSMGLAVLGDELGAFARTLAPICTLATSTCCQFDNGRFYAFEGVYCCPGTCQHVWNYAQSVARIFPELERDLRERADFGTAWYENGATDYRGAIPITKSSARTTTHGRCRVTAASLPPAARSITGRRAIWPSPRA
jgi:hypothetical protein